jgi:UDP-N-acetylmuramoylalanine--D-glutamate ligase
MKYDVVVIGSGESGTGTALLAQHIGLSVFVSDFGNISDQFQTELKAAGIPFEENGHTSATILQSDLIVKSPGVPEKAPIIQEIRKAGIDLIGEIEFAYRFMPKPARIVAITGSNGKTTTTTLTAHLMQQASMNVFMGGNVGKSFARLILEVRTGKPIPRYPFRLNAVYVLELSSFQLDDLKRFHADIAVLLNITPDHLDRYDYELDNYAASKFRVFLNQKQRDLAIYNADDPITSDFIEKTDFDFDSNILKLRVEPYALPSLPMIRPKEKFTLAGSRLIGPHNGLNAKAAIAVCRKIGMTSAQIEKGLLTYIPPPHRMELVQNKNGITWINDSKATNVDSVFFALQSVRAPIIWIAGGTDKGNDYTPLLDLVRDRVKAIICMGVDNSKLEKVFGKMKLVQAGKAPSANFHSTHSLKDALIVARAQATAGDTVLLSPACASFDLFKNYEDRGTQFREAVVASK